MGAIVLPDELAGADVSFEVHEFSRLTHAPLGMSMWDEVPARPGEGQPVLRVHHAAAVPMHSRQLRMVVRGGSVLLEPGTLQYARGSL